MRGFNSRTAATARAEVKVTLHGASPGEEGRPLLFLLHGNPGAATDFAALMLELRKFSTVATLDFPGFGESPQCQVGPATLDLEEAAALVISAASELGGLGRLHLIGHSHGGAVALAAAALHPEDVAGVTLLASLGVPAHGSYRLLEFPFVQSLLGLAGRLFRTRCTSRFLRPVVRRVMRPLFHPISVPAPRLDEEMTLLEARPEVLTHMAQLARTRPSAQLEAFVPRVQRPVLIIHGTEDALVPIRHARNLRGLLVDVGVNVDFQAVPDAGHMLPVFQPERVAALVRRFVAAARPLPVIG